MTGEDTFKDTEVPRQHKKPNKQSPFRLDRVLLWALAIAVGFTLVACVLGSWVSWARVAETTQFVPTVQTFDPAALWDQWNLNDITFVYGWTTSKGRTMGSTEESTETSSDTLTMNDKTTRLFDTSVETSGRSTSRVESLVDTSYNSTSQVETLVETSSNGTSPVETSPETPSYSTSPVETSAETSGNSTSPDEILVQTSNNTTSPLETLVETTSNTTNPLETSEETSGNTGSQVVSAAETYSPLSFSTDASANDTDTHASNRTMASFNNTAVEKLEVPP